MVVELNALTSQIGKMKHEKSQTLVKATQRITGYSSW